MTKVKYTDETLRELANRCGSVSEILRELGLRPAGGNHAHIKHRLDRAGIDTSGISGQGWRKGRKFPFERRSAEEVFRVRDDGLFTNGSVLKRKLLDVGVPDVCDVCGIGNEWNGKPLTLQVDHINGRRNDDRRENLRIICPNCHSQTPTFSGKKNGPLSQLAEDASLDLVNVSVRV